MTSMASMGKRGRASFEPAQGRWNLTAWFCVDETGRESLGEIIYSQKLGKYVYYQMYDAQLTAEQLRDIADFLDKANDTAGKEKSPD